MTYHGYIIREALSTGGKAGAGRNVTTTIQVLKDGLLLTAFRYPVGDLDKRRAAIEKAKVYVDGRSSK